MPLEERQAMLSSAGKHTLRRGPSGKAGGLGLKVESGGSVSGSGGAGGSASFQEQLKEALHKSLQRVMDLFRDWDDDFSGTIDRKCAEMASPEMPRGHTLQR